MLLFPSFIFFNLLLFSYELLSPTAANNNNKQQQQHLVPPPHNQALLRLVQLPGFAESNPPPYTVINIAAEAQLITDPLEELKRKEERKAQIRSTHDINQQIKENNKAYKTLAAASNKLAVRIHRLRNTTH